MRMVVDQISHFVGIPQHFSQTDQSLWVGWGLETMNHPQNSSWASLLLLGSCSLKQSSELCRMDWYLPSSFPLNQHDDRHGLEGNRDFVCTNFIIPVWFQTPSPIMLWQCFLNFSASFCDMYSVFALGINLVLNLTDGRKWGNLREHNSDIWDRWSFLTFFVLYF